MANNDSLKWSIEKIIDCDGNDITTGSWVSIKPMEGFGDTHASVSITPSEKYNDCQTATVTILTGTGDKKYVTINRCNPECNCDAIKFFPIELKNNIPASGGTVQVASYEMKYDCSDAYMDFINVESECKYEFGNGTVYAVVGENESTTSNREFEYYVTYNGTRCDNGSQSGSFSQDMAEDECVKEECNIDVYSTTISSIAWNVTEIDFKVDNLTDCWTLDYIGEHSGYDFTYFMSGEYITINVGSNDDYNNEKPFEFIFVFKNGAANKSCEIETDVITQGKRPVVQTCTTCTDIKIQKTNPQGQYKQFNSEGSNGKPEIIGEFNVSCHPEGGLEVVRVNSQEGTFVTDPTLFSTQDNSYKITGVVTPNNNASTRHETFQIRLKNSKESCSTIFGVEQLGKEPAPSDTCEIDAESVVYTTNDTGVTKDYKHMLSAFDHSNYSDPNKEIDYYDTFSETGNVSFDIVKKDSNGNVTSRTRINDHEITVTGLKVNKNDGNLVDYELTYVDETYGCGKITKRIKIPQRGYTLSMVIKEPLRQGYIDIGSDSVHLHSCRYGDYDGTLIPSFHIHDNGLPPEFDVFEVIDEEMTAEWRSIYSNCCCDNSRSVIKNETHAEWFGERFDIINNNIVYEKTDNCDNDECHKRSGCVTCNDYDYDFQDGDRELVAVFTVFDTEFYIHIFDA